MKNLQNQIVKVVATNQRAKPSRKAADPSASTVGEPEADEEKVPPPQPLIQLATVTELPAKWYAGIPMTVAVPGRRADLLRDLDVKPKAVVFKAKLLSAAVESIWTDLRHGALVYLNPSTEEISNRWKLIQAYLAKVLGTPAQMREFMSEVPWKLIVDWSWCLFKCYGPRIATALERASFNYMAHFPQELVPHDKLKEKARKDIGETTEYLEDSITRLLRSSKITFRLFHRFWKKTLTKFSPANLAKLISVNHVDAIVGGPPCQGFSTVRQVDGANNGERLVEDPRRYLYQEFLRYVEFFQPKVFVMENVLGIRSASGGEYFIRVQKEARAIGYRVHAQVEDCVELGLPQKRRRQLFIGTRLDLPDYFRPEIKPAPRACDHPSLWEAIGDLPPVKAGEGEEAFRLRHGAPQSPCGAIWPSLSLRCFGSAARQQTDRPPRPPAQRARLARLCLAERRREFQGGDGTRCPVRVSIRQGDVQRSLHATAPQ